MLQGAPAWGLPAARFQYSSQYPCATLRSNEPAIPLLARIQAFSVIIPHQLPDSAWPGFVLVGRLHNPLSEAVKVSLLVSWQSLGTGREMPGRLLPGTEGIFGVDMRGGDGCETALTARPDRTEARVFTMFWNAFHAPRWWKRFAEKGTLPAAASRQRGDNAAAVCVRFTLPPGQDAVVPFGVAWFQHAPGPNAPYYTRLCSSAAQASQHLVHLWLTLYILMREWQYQWLFSNLPDALQQKLMEAVQPLVQNTLLAADGRLIWRGSPSVLMQQEVFPCLQALYPPLAKKMAEQQKPGWGAALAALHFARSTGNSQWLAKRFAALLPLAQQPAQAGMKHAFAHALLIGALQQMARLLHHAAEAASLQKEAQRAASRFNRAYWNGKTWASQGTALPPGFLREAIYAKLPLPAPHMRAAVQYAVHAPVQNSLARVDAALLELMGNRPDKGLERLQNLSLTGLARSAVWPAALILAGARLNLLQGRLTLLPNLPGIWRSLHCPLQTPGFLASITYSPQVHGGSILLRIDRQFSRRAAFSLNSLMHPGAALLLTGLTVPGPPPLPPGAALPPLRVYVSVNHTLTASTAVRLPNGTLRLLFPAPLPLQTGDMLLVQER